jgi:hypothetical protein
VRATDEDHGGAESRMCEFSDEQLVDFVLGLGTDHGLTDAVRAEPEGGSLRSLVSLLGGLIHEYYPVAA